MALGGAIIEVMVERCQNTACTQRQECVIIRRLTDRIQSGEPVAKPSEVAEQSRRAKVIFNCPNSISGLLTQLK